MYQSPHPRLLLAVQGVLLITLRVPAIAGTGRALRCDFHPAPAPRSALPSGFPACFNPWACRRASPARRIEMTIAEFCDRHCACTDGRAWALAHCTTMREAWDTARPDWLIWIACQPGVMTDRDARLFACWAVRQIWPLLADKRSRAAVEVEERYADGHATKDELDAARAAARDVTGAAAWWAAAWDATRAASWAAARAAAGAAAWAAARAAARDASRAAARDASRDAARYAAWAAAWDAAWAAQSAYLRDHIVPNFAAEVTE